jgi:hypothetical protein
MLAVVVLLLGADGGVPVFDPQGPSVVQLGEGFAFAVHEQGVFLTTHRLANALARPEALRDDGGTVQVIDLLHDDPERDVALVQLDGRLWRPARFLAGGAIGPAGPQGAPLLDGEGRVTAMSRLGAPPLPAAELVALLEPSDPPGRLTGERVRNLSISAAFFLGLAGWWVYRSRARRY